MHIFIRSLHYGINGISPHISKVIISAYIDPAVLYGLEALCLDRKDFDRAQHLLIRQIQGLPKSTAIPAVYLLLGILPMTAQLHKKILTLFVTVLNRPGSAEYDVVLRQLCMKSVSSNSWTSQVKRILFKYDLPTSLQLAENPPSMTRWKRMVKWAVKNYWEDLR